MLASHASEAHRRSEKERWSFYLVFSHYNSIYFKNENLAHCSPDDFPKRIAQCGPWGAEPKCSWNGTFSLGPCESRAAREHQRMLSFFFRKGEGIYCTYLTTCLTLTPNSISLDLMDGPQAFFCKIVWLRKKKTWKSLRVIPLRTREQFTSPFRFTSSDRAKRNVGAGRKG